MKVQGKTIRTQTIEGTITVTDLLALVRETFVIPDRAKATFHVIDSGSRHGTLVQAQLGWQPSPVIQITDGTPVHFRIDWSLPDGPSEQG
jgi:hypothetical protein